MGDEASPGPTEPQQQHNKVSERERCKDTDGIKIMNPCRGDQ